MVAIFNVASKPRVVFQFRGRSPLGNRRHDHGRTHPLRGHECLDGGEGGTLLTFAARPAHLDQTKADAGEDGQRGRDICNRR